MFRRNVNIGFIVLGMIIINACNSPKPPEQKPAPPVGVVIDTIEKEPAVYFDKYPAVMTPLNQVDLKAQVTGYITGIYFTDGQHVQKGQKLYDIDRQQYQANYDQAVANLNVSKASLAKAQLDVDRYNELLKQDAIARQKVDYALSDLQTAKMQVAAAQANVARLSNDLRFSVIYAPFDGTIGISQAKIGTLVTANQNILNTVSSDNPMAVDIAVNQKEIVRFMELQKKANKAADSIFTLLLPDNSVFNQAGQISMIDRAVDPQTVTIKTRLVFSNPTGKLKAGMNTTILVKNNNAEMYLLAPYKAVVEQMGEFFVFQVGDSNKVSQRKVLLGTRINEKIIIKDGLKEGDKIVIEGVQKLKEGTVVNTASQKPVK